MATVIPESRGPRRNIGGGLGAGVAAFLGARDEERKKQEFKQGVKAAEQAGDKATYRQLLMEQADTLEDMLAVDKMVKAKFPGDTRPVSGYDENGAERTFFVAKDATDEEIEKVRRSRGLQATVPLGKAEVFEGPGRKALGSFLPGKQPEGSRRTSVVEGELKRRSTEGIAAAGRAESADTPNKRQGRILEQMARNTANGKDINEGLEGKDVELVQSLFGDPAITNAFKALSQNPKFFRLLRNDLEAAFEMVVTSANMLTNAQGQAGGTGKGAADFEPIDARVTEENIQHTIDQSGKTRQQVLEDLRSKGLIK